MRWTIGDKEGRIFNEIQVGESKDSVKSLVTFTVIEGNNLEEGFVVAENVAKEVPDNAGVL